MSRITIPKNFFPKGFVTTGISSSIGHGDEPPPQFLNVRGPSGINFSFLLPVDKTNGTVDPNPEQQITPDFLNHVNSMLNGIQASLSELPEYAQRLLTQFISIASKELHPHSLVYFFTNPAAAGTIYQDPVRKPEIKTLDDQTLYSSYSLQTDRLEIDGWTKVTRPTGNNLYDASDLGFPIASLLASKIHELPQFTNEVDMVFAKFFGEDGLEDLNKNFLELMNTCSATYGIESHLLVNGLTRALFLDNRNQFTSNYFINLGKTQLAQLIYEHWKIVANPALEFEPRPFRPCTDTWLRAAHQSLTAQHQARQTALEEGTQGPN